MVTGMNLYRIHTDQSTTTWELFKELTQALVYSGNEISSVILFSHSPLIVQFLLWFKSFCVSSLLFSRSDDTSWKNNWASLLKIRFKRGAMQKQQQKKTCLRSYADTKSSDHCRPSEVWSERSLSAWGSMDPKLCFGVIKGKDWSASSLGTDARRSILTWRRFNVHYEVRRRLE